MIASLEICKRTLINSVEASVQQNHKIRKFVKKKKKKKKKNNDNSF